MVEGKVFIVDVRGRVQTKLGHESRWSLGQSESGEEGRLKTHRAKGAGRGREGGNQEDKKNQENAPPKWPVFIGIRSWGKGKPRPWAGEV